MAQAQNQPREINLKLIKIVKFTGSGPPRSLEANPTAWLTGFNHQVDTVQLLSGRRWTEDEKKGALSMFLDGPALKWFLNQKTSFTILTCEQVAGLLEEKFKSKLDQATLIHRLSKEQKLPKETYQEYADRLLDLVSQLVGGEDNEQNLQLAIATFCSYALPSEAGVITLRSTFNQEARSMHAELDRLVRAACQIRTGNGSETEKNSEKKKTDKKSESKSKNKRKSEGEAKAAQGGKRPKVFEN